MHRPLVLADGKELGPGTYQVPLTNGDIDAIDKGPRPKPEKGPRAADIKPT